MWCTGRVKIRLAAVVVALAALAGCSTPPGPAPTSPAPTLPEDAIAYDDLLSTDRDFPFDNTCDQVPPGTLDELGAKGARVIGLTGRAEGCAIEFGAADLDQLWIETKFPPNPSEPRFFPLLWNGDAGSTTYHRRLLLEGRYYAVETIDFYGSGPSCHLTVDTGSPDALQFRGILSEQAAASYGELNYSVTNYVIDHAGIDRFMKDTCPAVEKAAAVLIGDIDPGGGSLATS